MTVALISDLHDRPCEPVLERLTALAPDIITIPGDLTSRLDCAEGATAPNERVTVTHKSAFKLLRGAAALAPTFYSLGNHEICVHNYKLNFNRRILRENLEEIGGTGAVLLDDRFCFA